MAMSGTLEVVQEELEAIQPYSMHVSSKYLELTSKKLELTRLPRELELTESRRWEYGVPKAVLEPLLDFWLESYDWRTQEAHFNTALPQYRTTIPLPSSSQSQSQSQPQPQPRTASQLLEEGAPSLRIHFVHKRSKHKNAIPLLFCHTWPASFIEVNKIIDALTDPQSLSSLGAGSQQAFHVVAPSIPGFGFSDASPVEDFGLYETADCFHAVMRKLGYEHYVGHGTGWGFNICRAVAINHPRHCLAVHTCNPAFAEPNFKRSPSAWAKYRVAKWTKARIAALSFGYVPSELLPTETADSWDQGNHPSSLLGSSNSRGGGATLTSLYALRPQTLAFSLCDSPIGLLACLLDIIHRRTPSDSHPAPRSRSPFLSPSELELQDGEAHSAANGSHTPTDRTTERTHHDDSDLLTKTSSWSPTEMLNWTMLTWLPGPEASLRWLRRATLDSNPTSRFSTSYCPVPLGISSFQRGSGGSGRDPGSTPLMWGAASWHIAWVKRHQRAACLSPAWEAPDQLVLDMRECFGTFRSNGTVNLPVQES
ncbi:alpha/beta-hydrolase [Aaosphaeria arxii CBS 175.79]|uniref:Alpha/beta-hydrolase n=1 Tax=Aaosphaeria arxii CBS 175.79 TaxID=1450172 RepID=A0A6A5Y9M9_9PLEO|nr:alpha/beta-hydrolase [Aaosphaeria arxii CBS 175.79]KAF2021294.1 alpha/beta-hydrolase [Aaosphaeria arxii CBS 175.79]